MSKMPGTKVKIFMFEIEGSERFPAYKYLTDAARVPKS